MLEERVKGLPHVCTVVLDTAVYGSPEDGQDREALGIETLALVPHTPIIHKPFPAIFGVTAPRSLIQPVAYDQISRALAQQLIKMIRGEEVASEIAFAGKPVAIQQFVHDVNSSHNPLVIHVHPGDETIELIKLLRNSTGFFQKEIHEMSLLPGTDEIILDTQPFEDLLAEIGEELPTPEELAVAVGRSVKLPLLAYRLATAFRKCPEKMRLAYLAIKLFVNAKYSIGPYNPDAPSPHSK